MKKAFALLCLFTGLLISSSSHAAISTNGSLNILLIIADDLGVDNVSVYNEQPLNMPPTPNINSLAHSGVMFRNVWAHPKCSPSRASIYTGRHAFRHGVTAAGPAYHYLNLTEETLGNVLSSAGYTTALFGKWHLGSSDGYLPTDRGYDYFSGMTVNPGTYFGWTKTVSAAPGNYNQVTESGYATSVLVNETVEWIEQQADSSWFVTLAFNAPHVPMHVPPTGLYYRSLRGSAGDSCDGSNNSTAECYRAMVEAMDTEIGRLFYELDSLGVLKRTLIIFVGDNGTPDIATVTEEGTPFADDHAKGTVYEGGINVPLIISGGGQVGINVAGSQARDQQAKVMALDLFSTVTEVAAATPISGNPLDSISLLPYLDDDRANPQERKTVYSELLDNNDDLWAMSNGTLKVISDQNVLSCYNLVHDAAETKDIIATDIDTFRANGDLEIEDVCVECIDDSYCIDGVCLDNACVECANDDDCIEGTCDSNVCIPYECTEDADCIDGVCLDNTCVECADDDDCIEGTCDSNVCIPYECTEDGDCSSGDVCDVGNSYACVECANNDDCIEGTCDSNVCIPYECTEDDVCSDDDVCDVGNSYECVECVNGNDCKGDDVCSNNTCVECANDNDCKGDDVCSNNTCVECGDDGDCIEGTCDSNVCIPYECTEDGDCSSGDVCDVGNSYACVECADNNDCDDGEFCNGEERCAGGVCSSGMEPCDADKLCDEENDECVVPPDCKGDADCAIGVCVDGTCVECKIDGDCSGEVCSDGNVCVECADDDDCSDGACSDDNICIECMEDGDCPEGICLENSCFELPDLSDDLQTYLSTLQEGEKAYKLLLKAEEALEAYLDALEPKDKKALKNLGKVLKYIEKAGEVVPDNIVENGLDAILSALENIAENIDSEINGLHGLLDAADGSKLLQKQNAAKLALNSYYAAKDAGDQTASQLTKFALKAIKKYMKALALGHKLV